jgi:hypothetical protein
VRRLAAAISDPAARLDHRMVPTRPARRLPEQVIQIVEWNCGVYLNRHTGAVDADLVQVFLDSS